MAESSNMLSILFCVLCSALAGQIVSPCPDMCSCSDDIVNCSSLNLTIWPANVPNTAASLHLDDNLIQQILLRHFVGMGRLITLSLRRNQLESVPDFSFANLHQLKELRLRGNNIASLQMNALAGLSQLNTLDLADNNMSALDDQAFHDLLNVKHLYLHGNNISAVRTQTLAHLHKLRLMKIDKSTLLCTCQATEAHNRSVAHCPAQPPVDDHSEGELYSLFTCALSADNAASVRFVVSDTVSLLCKLHERADHLAAIYVCKNTLVRKRLSRFKRHRLHRSASPSRVEVDAGSPAQLPCKISAPHDRYEWYFEHRPTPILTSATLANKYRMLQDGRLLISGAEKSDSGNYQCVVVSGKKRVRSSVQLVVRYSPVFSIMPSDLLTFEGSRSEMSCEATGHPTPVLSWLKDNRPVRQSRRVMLEKNGSILSVYPMLREDAGVYTCQASNVIGTARASGVVHIKSSSPPTVTLAPESQTVSVKDTASFQCRASGDPVPRIVWSFNGSPVPTVRGHFEISKQNTLYVHEATSEDEGHYTCQAVNEVGAVTAEAKLTVDYGTTSAPRRAAAAVINRSLIVDSVKQATFDIDRAINSTRLNLQNNKLKDPAELLALFRYPGPQAVELARAREIYEQSLRLIKRYVSSGLRLQLDDEFEYESLLSPAHLQMISELSGCNVHKDEPNCNDACFHAKYRTYDGSCNNLQHPMRGASHTAFARLLPAVYENGFDRPVGWTSGKLYHGYSKPNPRKVVNEIIAAQSITPDAQHSHMLMQWGQFVDHDLDFAILSPSIEQFDGGLRCKATCQNSPPCFNIDVPADDPRIKTIRCIEMERSSAVCGSGETSLFFNKLQPREQINQISSFIDGSNIYGSTEASALDLRDLYSDHGLLKFDITSHKQKAFLPFNRDAAMDCRRNRSVEHPVRCFLAGDHRANEQLGLLAMHTLWLREHNRVASALFKMNAHWDGEKLFQEARKIVVAQLQLITYKHWLPKVLGPSGTAAIGEYSGYDADVDPSIVNEFAAAAFRFGHTLIQPTLLRLNNSFQPISDGHVELHDAFFAPDKLLAEGGVDPLLRGLFASPAKLLTADQFMNAQLTEQLFAKAHHVALDLASLNLQRGRDHAIQHYTAYRELCNLSTADNFEQLRRDIASDELLDRLQRLYGHPANIDLFVGALSEKKMPGAKIGPTFVCIIAQQFKRLRDGDRFYYENPGVFSQMQLNEIKKASLARVLCDNGDEIDKVQKDVFVYPGSAHPSKYGDCRQIPSINLNMWQECCSDSCGSTNGGSAISNDLERSKRSPIALTEFRNMEQRLGKLEKMIEVLRKQLPSKIEL